jgi:hypothetical protein
MKYSHDRGCLFLMMIGAMTIAIDESFIQAIGALVFVVAGLLWIKFGEEE